jgi:hypothetical protein
LDTFFEFICFEATKVPMPGAVSLYHKTARLFENVMKTEVRVLQQDYIKETWLHARQMP